MSMKKEDCCRTGTNGPTFHGMVKGRVVKTAGTNNVTRAYPGGTRSGGMTPRSWQGGGGGGKKTGDAGRMADGYPTRDGYIGW